MNKESFIYLWYDAPNKKYYLGKHKGSPDDKYTHSSRVWEHFTKDNIPEGVTRRILAYGTDEEMCILEHKLLVNRKKRCWDRYYNNGVGDPRYVDISGENHPFWKGGISLDKTTYMKVYQQTPAQVEYQAKYMATYWQNRKNKDKHNKPSPLISDKLYKIVLKNKSVLILKMYCENFLYRKV